MAWADLKAKAGAVAALFLFSSPVLELTLFVLTAIGTFAGLQRGVFRLHPRVWPMVLAMTLAFLALPRLGLGTAYIDYRIPSGAIFFVLGFMIPGSAMPRFVTWITSWFSALVIVRVASIAALWLAWEPDFAKLDDALQQLPVGARVMVVEGWKEAIEINQPPIEHAAAFVVARRQGFEPNLFASTAAEILYLRPQFEPLYQIRPPKRLEALNPAYVHLLVIRPALANVSPNLPLTLLARGN